MDQPDDHFRYIHSSSLHERVQIKVYVEIIRYPLENV